MRTIPSFTITQLERFAAKFQISDTGCWLWTGALADGYGIFGIKGKWSRGAHRIAYILIKGPIPARLQLDHLCRVRNCINPAHLEAVTLAENVKRSSLPDYIYNRKLSDKCKYGHLYTPENTRYDNPGNKRRQAFRVCRKCENLRSIVKRRKYKNNPKS
jgi:HNH endonuclease